ncbi:AraC family transcriptional regulator [uncultured Maribacter sp.]|uniref:AraC family transcriptional regulator n=1 Tax=uncultured Maribacter sp. TaxID=431308 RepID=UPI002618BBD0|nr:AraC family transcriptional regulator [uncultured Maribacter sp.]
MKPVFENIDVNHNSSLKIASYNHSSTNETAHWHIHPEYEIVFIKNGKGSLKIGTKSFSYLNGLLIFLKGNIPHTDFGNNDFEDNFEVVIQFKKEFISKKLTTFPELQEIEKFIDKGHHVLLFSEDFKDSVASLFEKIRKDSESQKLITTLSILEKIANTKAYSVAIKGNEFLSQSVTDSKRLEQVFEYVNTNYKNTITISHLAEHVGLTSNSFCRFFKKMTNQTFVYFLNDYRINKASEIIRFENKNLTEIMFECGFQDQSYFCKVFKKHQGLTPSDFAKSFYTK